MLRHLKQLILTTLFAIFASQASAMFIQPDWLDPTEPGVVTNRYSYSFNDPMNRFGPSGNRTFWEDVRDLFSSREERLDNNTERAVNEVETFAINEVNYATGYITEEGYVEARRRAQNRLSRYSRFIENNGGSFGAAVGDVVLGALDNGVLLSGGGGLANRVASSALAIRMSNNQGVRNGAVTVLTTSQGTFIGLNKNVARDFGATRTVDPKLVEMSRAFQRTAGGFCGTCGEIHAISQALAAGAKLDGARISTAVVAITKNAAGRFIAPCGSCAEALKSLGVKY